MNVLASSAPIILLALVVVVLVFGIGVVVVNRVRSAKPPAPKSVPKPAAPVVEAPPVDEFDDATIEAELTQEDLAEIEAEAIEAIEVEPERWSSSGRGSVTG